MYRFGHAGNDKTSTSTCRKHSRSTRRKITISVVGQLSELKRLERPLGRKDRDSESPENPSSPTFGASANDQL